MQRFFFVTDIKGENAIAGAGGGGSSSGDTSNLQLGEWLVYGSKSHGRFSTVRPTEALCYSDLFSPAIDSIFTRKLRYREYELKNHLGNIMLTFSDMKMYNPSNIDLLSANNYYSFGMLEPERSWAASKDYRYGYNGKERDDAIKGEGNSLDYGARMLDSKIARWGSRDALEAKYPGISTYAYCANNPLIFVDPDGKDWELISPNQQTTEYFKSKISECFHGKVKVEINNNLISLIKEPNENFHSTNEEQLFKKFQDIIQNKKEVMTTTLLDKNDEYRNNFPFDMYASKGILDIYDFACLNNKNEGDEMSLQSWMAHCIGEQYSKQILHKNEPGVYLRDHNYAIEFWENPVGGIFRPLLESRTDNTKDKYQDVKSKPDATGHTFDFLQIRTKFDDSKHNHKLMIFNCDLGKKNPNYSTSTDYSDIKWNSKQEIE